MSRTGPRTLITIDGVDGSGKSRLAQRLVTQLGPAAVSLCVDDFRRPLPDPHDPRDRRAEHDRYYEDRFDFAALDRCVTAFLGGAASLRYQAFDGQREQLGPERELQVGAADHLVLEGVFVARLASFAQALSVFVQVTEAQARERILERDTVQKRRSRVEVEARMDQRYFPSHRRYLQEHRPDERAHLRIDNGDLAQPVVVQRRLVAAELSETTDRALRALGWL